MSKGVLLAVGTFSVWWGVKTFPVFWQDAGLDHTAESILNGERFKPEDLRTDLAAATSEQRTWTRPEALRSVAILQLSLVEQQVTDNGEPPNSDVNQLQAFVRRSLSATPADPMLWLVLFWANKLKDGQSQGNFANLRMSYFVGPNEGWVASRRNYIAVANFSDLPQDLKEAALTEFKNLVISGYFDTATKILLGPGWTIHDRLLHSLETAPDEVKRRLASSVGQLGYDISVPGVERPEPRPWR